MSATAKCLACGSDNQRYIGRLWNRPADVYHCAACDRLYALPDGHHFVESLTEEERQLAKLIGNGLMVKQMARRMGVSVRTLCFRQATLMKKLGAISKAELMRKIVELGLCD